MWVEKGRSLHVSMHKELLLHASVVHPLKYLPIYTIKFMQTAFMLSVWMF